MVKKYQMMFMKNFKFVNYYLLKIFYILFTLFVFTIFLKLLPEKWNNTKKLAMQAKQQVAPLQTNEVANIRRKTASFDVQQYEFREKFRQEAPFKYDSEQPYSKIDKV